jgi:ferredoxin-nitrite reductase
VPSEDCPSAVERLLKAYMARRAAPTESFFEFASRHEIGTLQSIVDEVNA